MPCSEFGLSDWWFGLLNRDATDSHLASLERDHLRLARAARRHLHSRQLALSHELKALTVFNQRVSLRLSEQRQALSKAQSAHNFRKADSVQRCIHKLEAMLITVDLQQVQGVNSRLPYSAPAPPQPQAMAATYPTYAHPGVPVPVALPLVPLPSPSYSSRYPAGAMRPPPSAPHASGSQERMTGESVTYMSGQSMSSRALGSAVLSSSSSSTASPLSASYGDRRRDVEVMGDSPPPYYYHEAYPKIQSTSKVHVMLGEEQ